MTMHSTYFERPHGGLRMTLSRWVEGFLQAMEDHAARMPHARELRRLSAKSDAELAEMGLTRADVPRYALGAMHHV